MACLSTSGCLKLTTQTWPPTMPRERLPYRRRAIGLTLDYRGNQYDLAIGLYDDGRPGELFASGSKSGSDTVADLGVLISRALQHGDATYTPRRPRRTYATKGGPALGYDTRTTFGELLRRAVPYCPCQCAMAQSQSVSTSRPHRASSLLPASYR